MCEQTPTPNLASQSFSIELELEHKNYILDTK